MRIWGSVMEKMGAVSGLCNGREGRERGAEKQWRRERKWEKRIRWAQQR
jgi:hypothetical protein